MSLRYGHPRNLFMRLLSTCLFLAGVMPSTFNVSAQTSDKPMSPESFILQQVSLRKEANLEGFHDRKISAEFLEALLISNTRDDISNQPGVAILNAEIVGNFEIPNTEVARETILNNCQFDGKVDLSGTHFRYDLSLLKAHFLQDVSAGQLKVDGDLNLKDAQAAGDFDLAASAIGGTLYLSGAQILADKADFGFLKVGTHADFTRLASNGTLSLAGADLQSLMLGGTPAPKVIDLTGAVVHRHMSIQAAKFESLRAGGLQVLGQALFQDVNITSDVDFTDAHFQDLIFQDAISWPAQESSFRMDGITFSSVYPGNEKDVAILDARDAQKMQVRWNSLLDNWVDRSTFSPQVYQQLETAFRTVGMTTLSNSVFEHMKTRELTEGHLTTPRKIWNFLLWIFVGYGREPQRALLWSLAVVVFGCFVFPNKDYVIARRPEDEKMTYNPFWYSLGLFLPLETLLASDVWVPKQDDRFRRNYARIHTLLGWILIPFGLAAITGLIPGK